MEMDLNMMLPFMLMSGGGNMMSMFMMMMMFSTMGTSSGPTTDVPTVGQEHEGYIEKTVNYSKDSAQSLSKLQIDCNQNMRISGYVYGGEEWNALISFFRAVKVFTGLLQVIQDGQVLFSQSKSGIGKSEFDELVYAEAGLVEFLQKAGESGEAGAVWKVTYLEQI